MIPESEVRRLTAAAGVDPMVQDLDYALGWFLAGLFQQVTPAPPLVFKGGTCLRKGYFADYRFSEDLDVTLIATWSVQALHDAIRAIQHWSQDMDGPDFAARNARVETINDEYGQESYQARIYYRGPLRWGGPPRSIQIDVTRGEIIVFPVQRRQLIHQYSDNARISPISIPCYSLEEMLSEKLRAIAGQRRFAIARDLYDIFRLVTAGVTLDRIREALPSKFAAKGMKHAALSMETLIANQAAYQADWQRRLLYLLPRPQRVEFEAAWQVVLDAVRSVTQVG